MNEESSRDADIIDAVTSRPMDGSSWPVDGEAEHYQLFVNGRLRPVDDAWLGESLLYVLRGRLGLPGSKNACEQGECGACSTLVDDVLVCSCCVLAADAVGSEIVTVEGITNGPELTDVQDAMLKSGGVQCGFCTPGLVMAIHDLLVSTPRPTVLEIREGISGNLCRCTGYGRIVAAVQMVVAERAND